MESKFSERFPCCALAILVFAVLLLESPPSVAKTSAVTVENALRVQLERERNKLHFPGGTAAFTLPDGSSGSVAVGLRDQERGFPMESVSRMPAGSIGKTFVAALTLALVGEGKVSLDDHLSKWLGDEVWFSRLPNAADIRIRDLLNHGAGISDHVESQGFAELAMDQVQTHPRVAIEPVALINLVLDQPPLFPAGKGYAYTDTGYILLQLVIEKAGGFQLGEEVMRRFVYPLQLNSTAPADGVLHAGLAQGYVNQEFLPGLPSTTLDNGVLRWNPMSEWAGGGFISTSLDLAHWLTGLFQGSADLSEVAAMMISPANVNTYPEGFAYGLGISITKSQWGRVWYHQGVYPGYRSYAAWFPDCKIGFALQVNTDRIGSEESGELGRALAGVVLAHYLPRNRDCSG